MTTLRVGTYNLRDGGFDNGHDDRRLHCQLAMMRELDVDAWAIQEAKHWEGPDRSWETMFMAEQKLGMRGFPVRSNHHGCHLIIFVRPPCEVTAICHDRAAPYWHALCEVRARVGGTELTLANAHLAPSAPTIRRCEAEPLKLVARRAKAGTSIPAIMMGDFNAIPWGDPDPDPPQGIDPGKYAAKRDRAPARAIEQAGFIDVGHHVGDLAPTVGHLGGLPYRCDRIYTTLPSGSIAGYQVIHEAKPYSDHLPVTAVLTIPSPPNIV